MGKLDELSGLTPEEIIQMQRDMAKEVRDLVLELGRRLTEIREIARQTKATVDRVVIENRSDRAARFNCSLPGQ